jgi:hypothetical protein
MVIEDILPVHPNIYVFNTTTGLISLSIQLYIIFYIIHRLYIKKEIEKIKEERRYVINLITWAIFFMLFAAVNIFHLIRANLIQMGVMTPSIFPIFEKIEASLLYTAFFVKIIYIEYVINNLKFYRGYYSSIMFAVVYIFILFIDLEQIKTPGPLQIVFLILLIIGYSIIPVLYLLLAIKTVRESRKNALKVSIGMTLFGVGSLMGPSNLRGLYGLSDFMDWFIDASVVSGPITVLVGLLLIYSSIHKKN